MGAGLLLERTEARTRQESSITAKTQGSTEHSDHDNQLRKQSSNSQLERPAFRRNLSNNDRVVSAITRSRGISGISGDLHLANHT